MPARHVHGAGQVRLLELVLLAHVDDHGAVAVLRQLVDVPGVDLLDLLFDPADDVRAGSHYFRKDSAASGTGAAPPERYRGALSSAPVEDPDLDFSAEAPAAVPTA
jgi:hypothetical protein